MVIEAEEVLVLDSSTFIREIGLTSPKGSALKHYLYSRETQLVVPQAAAEEYERNLVSTAKDKIKRIQKELRWLAQFCDGIPGWTAPDNDEIKNRAMALAEGDSFGAMLLPETTDCRLRAQCRNQDERPPGHLKDEFGDCRIWEQCLELLSGHDVVFVSADRDFQSHRERDSLHPQLRAEAEAVGMGRSLTFHTDIVSLLCELRKEIPPIPDAKIFEFVYETNKETMQELRLNSGCSPTKSGRIEQIRLATGSREVIEVRLKVTDNWESLDGATSLPFELSGLCRYHLGDGRLSDLRTDVVRMVTKGQDGAARSVKGSRVFLSGIGHIGTPSMDPEQGIL